MLGIEALQLLAERLEERNGVVRVGVALRDKNTVVIETTIRLGCLRYVSLIDLTDAKFDVEKMADELWFEALRLMRREIDKEIGDQ